MPQFQREFKTVRVVGNASSAEGVLTLQVAPDYLAVGCDTNFLRVPLTPMTAQRIADGRLLASDIETRGCHLECRSIEA